MGENVAIDENAEKNDEVIQEVQETEKGDTALTIHTERTLHTEHTGEANENQDILLYSIHAKDLKPETIENSEPKMILVKESDMQRMKDLIIKLKQDRADKDAFADVTRRLMYLFSGIPTKTAEILKIVKFVESCYSLKKGVKTFSFIKLGKKLAFGELPMDEISSLGEAVNTHAFEGFQPINYGDAFNRNNIPIIDIAPIIDVVKPFFNIEKTGNNE